VGINFHIFKSNVYEVDLLNMKNRIILFTLLISVIFSQGWNTTFIGQLDYPQFVNDVWGYKADNGKEYALVGTSLGTAVVDVTTNPFGPQQVGFITGDESTWRDIKFWNNHMYISTEAEMGIQVADITDPENPELVYEWDGVSRAHNLFQADGYLYVVGADEGTDMEILDLTDPAVPVRVGGWSGEYLHDVYVRDNYAYGCGIYSSTMYIIDISDKENPFTLTSWTYPGSAHACWLTEDGDFLISGDETSGGHIKIWDIRDLDNINMVSEWMPEGGENKSAHNVFVRGDYLYISYYVFGLQILDISDPFNPELAGYYDTYPGEEGLYEGNWGVYPFAESCHSYVSDMEAGLVLVDFDECINPDPGLMFSPDNFNIQTTQGETLSEILTLTNNGNEGSTLFYQVEAIGISPFENPGGGPDEFGYEWSDSDIETDISYEWIDIQMHFNTEEVQFITNDDAPLPIQLHFEFPFYGYNYSHFIVNPNGWIGFGSDNSEFDNISVPSPDAPAPAVLALWDDLNPVNVNCNEYCSGRVFVNIDNDRAVIWYNDVARWYSGDMEAYFDFQIVLYPTGKIRINYRNIDGSPTATIGIQNQEGTDGLLVNFLTDYVHDFLTLEYFTGENPTWLTFGEGADEGQLLSGESEDVIIQIDTDTLEPGEYSTALKLLNNALPDISVPLNLSVVDPEGDITLNITHISDWNLVGLPVGVSDSHYYSVFPESVPESCFGYDDEYTQTDEMELGDGYWLRFSSEGSTDITGSALDELELNISEGWNIISGVSDIVNVNTGIVDPMEILVSGSLYGFDGTYVNSSVLEPGKGYWIRSLEDGSITISSQNRSGFVRRSTVCPDANTLRVNGMELYFGENISDIDPVLYSLPPKPPTGATDIRFSDDTKFCMLNDCLIEVAGDGRPLKFDCNIKDGEEWQLVDESGKEYNCSNTQEIELNIESGYIVLKKITTSITPQSFSLGPAYPNPFNPLTRIRFTVPEMTEVNLSVYDLKGKLMDKLVNKTFEPGTHVQNWDAQFVSSGVYFLVMEAGTYSSSQKLILMK